MDVNGVKEREAIPEGVHLLGDLYAKQGRLAEAENMYQRTLQGKEDALGPKYTSTLGTINNLGLLYAGQGRLAEAEEMYKRALHGYKDALGDTLVRQYKPALNTLENMGNLYVRQGNHVEAQKVYSRALAGLQSILGQSSERCKQLEAKIHALSTPQASEVGRTQPPAVEDALKSRSQQETKTSNSSFRHFIKRILR